MVLCVCLCVFDVLVLHQFVSLLADKTSVEDFVEWGQTILDTTLKVERERERPVTHLLSLSPPPLSPLPAHSSVMVAARVLYRPVECSF